MMLSLVSPSAGSDKTEPGFVVEGSTRSASELLQDARNLSGRFGEATLFAVNLCRCRYRFTLGFTAALAGGKVNLLPANRQPQTIASVLQQYPDSVVLHDQPLDEDVKAVLDDQGVQAIDLSQLPFEQTPITVAEAVPGETVAAIVFTSGSTGQPHAIAKPWHTLVGVTELLRQRFFGQSRPSIVATVPPQHMYGLETSVMMALHGQCLVSARQPLFPADVRHALEEVPAPRFLITTPLHLNALLRAKLPLPPLQGVISATAPLATQLAEDAEKAWTCRVREIFGCSEAGSLASRDTANSDVWQTLEGVELTESGGDVSVVARHLTGRIALQDRLEVLSPDRFRFVARSADMINIAGKRASLAELTAKLLAVEGVEDGVFFLRDDPAKEVQRLGALVVSSHDEFAIVRSLARCIDPVFMPRPLKRVSEIPRNELGKAPRSSLERLLRQSDSCEC